jgi:hypothetical protein
VYYHNLVTAENVWEPPKDWEEDRRANPPVMTDMSTQMDMTPPLCQGECFDIFIFNVHI